MSTEVIPLMRPWLGDAEASAAHDVVMSGWVTQGAEVAAFEKEFAAFVGAADAVAVSNCTVALQLALTAFGIGTGDEVITASYSFIATANSIRAVGATPVFTDVEEQSGNLDPDRVERAISPRTKAVLVPHQLGMPADLEKLDAICARHDIKLIEDAACAIGSQLSKAGAKDRIGRPYGDVACFSFHPRKLLTTGDGGMLSTDDPALAARLRLLRQHGMSVPDHARHIAKEVVFESYDVPGFNFRLTDIQAAIGRVQLGKIPAMVEERQRLACAYHRLLADQPRIDLPEEPLGSSVNWQTYMIRLDRGIDRRAAMQHLLDHGVATRRGVMSAHLEPAYAGVGVWRCGADRDCPAIAGACRHLPISEKLTARGLCLPLFHGMTEEQQMRVAGLLGEAIEIGAQNRIDREDGLSEVA